jgi:putative intracellular protease/amidase
MKTSFFTVLFFALNTGIASGQTLSPDTNKSIIFLCPPCGLDCDTVHFQKPGLCPTCGMKLFASYPGFENIQGEHLDNSDKKVAVVLFPGVEIIDFSGPWEVFGAAGMEVYSVAASDSILSAGMGLKIKPDYSFANAPVPDIILVPGGNVDPSDTTVVNWVVRTHQKSAHTMSVCTGAFYLAAGGLLDSLTATTNYPAIEALKGFAPKTTVIDKVRFVDNGRIITSAGLSSGMDAAFHLVSLYLGKAQTQKIANDLEYGWDNEDPFVRSKLADKYVQDFLNVFTPFDYEMTEYSGNWDKWLVTVRIKAPLSQEELLELLAIQFEQVAGWKKSGKKNTWTFDGDGKKWGASLHHVQQGNDGYLVTLNISGF